MSSLYTLCPHSDGVKLKLFLTKIVVQVHTHIHSSVTGSDELELTSKQMCRYYFDLLSHSALNSM